MTYILFFLFLLILLAAAAVAWGSDSRDLRDHPWESIGS